MLVYDPERTELVVQRLVLVGKSLRLAAIVGSMVVITALLTIAGGIVWPDVWWLLSVIGLFVGYGLGEYTTALLLALLEWMAQSLVAQNELIAVQRRRGES
ncbi:MAG: hypothetical protein M1546_21230 [Chloroflexi bacterium]|nr:hypothetical protein [Chloroflexota bacterium]